MVDLPEPDSPVKKTVKPCLWRGGWVRRSSPATSGKVNQSGMSSPSCSRRRSSVPERQHLLAGFQRVLLHVLCPGLRIDELLEWDHRHVELVLVLAEQVLGVVGAVERLAQAVVAGAGMVTADDEWVQP